MQEEKQSTSTAYIEPTICFHRENIKIGEDYTTDKVAVSQFVTKDQLLLEFQIPESHSSNKKVQRQSVKCGSFVHSSEDGNQIFATVAGYPKVENLLSDSSSLPILVVSIEPLFKITSNKMQASIAIHPPLEGHPCLADINLDELLLEAEITYGVNPDQVKMAKEVIQTKAIEFNTIILAQGQEGTTGQDAFLTYALEIGPIAGKMLPDGTIDFRERKIMVPISAGEVIAHKEPATEGTPGITVHNEELESVPGKDIIIKTLNDAKFIEDTNEVIATSDGALSIVGGNSIKVCSRQEIKSDIDFNTGNIESRNCVVIRGAVQPGFTVLCDGDLEIGGGVSSAKVTSHANIVVKGGITGKNSFLHSDGDTDLVFIEQGQIFCGENCVLRKQCYYSEVVAGGNIRCHKSSVVMGCQLIAEGSISVGDVGSQNADPSLLAAGVVGERLHDYDTMQKDLIKKQNEIIEWVQTYKGSSRSRKIRKMEREVEEAKVKLLRMNLIPGSGLLSRAQAGTHEEMLAGEEYSDMGSIDIGSITIEAHGTLYAGTKLRIGNRTLTLDKTVSNRLFKLNANNKRILALPLKAGKKK